MDFVTIVYALLASVIPSFIWLVFWLREDALHPEPRSLIATLFIGGIISVVIAIFGEKYISDIINDQNLRYTLWAALEEMVKFGIVIALALNTAYYDEPIDAMIYFITVALGFAAIENTLFILGPLLNGDIQVGIAMGSMRFIGASLVHVVSSAIIGFFIGYSFYRRKAVKYIYAIIGLIVAIALHASFNLSIINSSAGNTLRIFFWIWIAVVILMILFEEIKVVRPKNVARM